MARWARRDSQGTAPLWNRHMLRGEVLEDVVLAGEVEGVEGRVEGAGGLRGRNGDVVGFGTGEEGEVSQLVREKVGKVAFVVGECCWVISVVRRRRGRGCRRRESRWAWTRPRAIKACKGKCRLYSFPLHLRWWGAADPPETQPPRHGRVLSPPQQRCPRL